MLLSRLARLLGKPNDRILRRYIWLVVGASVMQGITFTMVVPVINALLAARLQHAAYWLIPLATGTAFSGYLNYRASQSGFEVATTLLETVRHRIGDHVVTLPLGWFVRRNTSRLGMLLSQGVMDILGLPAHQLTPLIRAILTPGVVVVATCFFDWRVGLSVAALFPIVALVYWWAGKLGRAADRAVHASGSEASDRMVEFAQNQLVLRTFGRGEQGFHHFDQALLTQHRASRRQLWLVLPPLLANAWLGQLGVLLLMAGVTWLVLAGNDAQQQTTLLALLVLMNRVIEPLSEVAIYSSGIRMATTQLDQVEQVLAQQPLPQPQRYTQQPTDHEIRFHDVTFSYHPGEPVLKNISVTLPGNTTTALVGGSGAGKSTFLQLIARFFDPDSGCISIGGADLKTLSAQQHMKMISQVFQSSYLFSGSLRENVLVGNPSASEDALRHVIAVARLDDVVSRLPQGWDSQVGEGGCLLSGGERQRVSIARALLKSAPILLLDEATGALDAENQLAITRGLEALHGRCTLLVIAHQLSTIQNADCILVMDEGRIIEKGTHLTLLTSGGRYADFWHTKIHAQGWRIQRTPPQLRTSSHD